MPRYQCLRCGTSYYSASYAEHLLNQRCELCDSMQFRVSRSPVLAGVAAGLGRPRRERAIEAGEYGCLPYDDADVFLRFALPFVREGLQAEARVVTSLDLELDLKLCERLDKQERAAIESVPASEIYGGEFDPERIITRYGEIAAESDQPLRLLGGPDGATAKTLDPITWHEYEHAVHAELERQASYSVSCLCVYDRRACSEDMLEAMHRTHPIVAGEFGFVESRDFDASTASL